MKSAKIQGGYVMRKFIVLLITLIMTVNIVPVMSLAAIEEYSYTVTNMGHSGSASGTGLFIGGVGDVAGGKDRAPFVSSVTGSNSVTVGSNRTGVIEFMIDGDIDPDTVTSAVLNVYVNSVNHNLSGSDWMLFAVYETENPELDYSIGGMDYNLYPAKDGDYSYEAAFWSNERCTRSGTGWKSVNVKRAVVNALRGNTDSSEQVRIVLRIQVPCAGLNISVSDNAAKLDITTGAKVEGRICTVDENGNPILPETKFVSGEGEYKHAQKVETKLMLGENCYIYDESSSVTEIFLEEGGDNTITLVYKKFSAEDFFSGYELINEGATCWFADPRSVNFKHGDIYEGGKLVLPASDKTIIGAIDDEGTVKAVQYDNITGKMVNVIIDTDFQKDDHNNPTFLYLPDRRIMVFWSQHTAEECFYYRVTEEPDDLTTLGEEKVISVAGYGTYTYPSPFYMTDTPESFFLCWRGVSWHPTIAKYSLPDKNGDIVCQINPTQMVDSIGARPYVKYESNGKDRIYFTFTTAHPDNNNPNWVYYAEIDVNTLNLYNIENKLLCEGKNLPYGKDNNINTWSDYGSLTVDNPSDKRDWVWDVCKGEDGVPVVLLTRISGGKGQHDYYYARWNTETKGWDKTYIANGGGWFHQNSGGAEKCYSGGMCLDHSDPSVVYLSKPTDGYYGKVYEIWKVVMNGSEIESETQITKNSEYNNVRPFVAWGSDSDDLISLTWMNGLYYYWIGEDQFPTTIMANSELPPFDYNYGLEKIELPENTSADMFLPSVTMDGLEIIWTTDNDAVIDEKGFVTATEDDEQVTLTATTTYGAKEFSIKVPARNVVKNNMLLHYEFDNTDTYKKDTVTYVADKSGRGNDCAVYGSANINGTLDLTKNTADVLTNGYATVPDGIFEDIKSYSFALRINAKNLANQPRLYDFGKDAGNSVFLRADRLSAGVKYNAGATAMLSPTKNLESNTDYFMTVTFDAKTKTTKVYVDGVLWAEGTNIINEPYKVNGNRNYIGRTQWWDTDVSGDNLDFCGTIDDFMLFDTALSVEEIEALYNTEAVNIDFYTESEAEGIRVNLIKENVPKDAVLIVAAYDENEILISSKVATGDEILMPIGEYIKVFCFENMNSIKPLCESAEKMIKTD